MIAIEGLSKRFGPFAAVTSISLRVPRGEVLGFLGPNGAGKSTTMKMITGYLSPSEGRVKICGHNMMQERRAAQALIGYLPEGAPAYDEMTPRGFLIFIARMRGFKKDRIYKAMQNAAVATELCDVLDQPIQTLSKGFRRRVGLAQAILSDPPVLIMDEPTDGLDPNQKHEVRQLIMRMAPHKAIIISTHILEEVEAVCSRAVILHEGRIVADGTPGELLGRSRYHNAVTLSIAGQMTVAEAASLKSLPGVADMETEARGAETRITLFPASEKELDTSLVDAVSAMAWQKNWHVRTLTNEAGRLDEVFRKLTRDAAKQVETKVAEKAVETAQ